MALRAPRLLMMMALAVASWPAVSWAWGDKGHRIVAEFASELLTPEAEQRVRALLGDVSLAEIATWADDLKQDKHYDWARPYHYQPRRQKDKDVAFHRDCPEWGCIVQAIYKYGQVLRDPDASALEQVEALKFLVHYVGDIHQPLHVGRSEDKGGNQVDVEFFGHSTNLHFVWDISLINHTGKGWQEYADELQERIAPEQIEKWKLGSVLRWAEESLQLSESYAYDIPENGKLGQEYFERCIPIADTRLSMAGVRLAETINRLFDDTAEVDFGIMTANFGLPQLVVGPWRATLDSRGGELPFGLHISRRRTHWKAWLVNGAERIEVPKVTYKDGELILDLEHYDSVIRATASTDGARLHGEWTKRSGKDERATMTFRATAGASPRFRAYSQSGPEESQYALDGKWAVKFAASEDPAVGVFETGPGGQVSGTFLTPTGDYRYLAGKQEGRHLRLSCFDGAHAFLFEAYFEPDGTLRGEFWSRDSWHDTWTARRDPQAKLPDAFGLTSLTGKLDLSKMVFADLEGSKRSLSDPEFAGQARIIEIFGTWCPNCNDATQYLVELHKRYGDKGLSIVGLAFELTGEYERDAEQLRRYAAHHEVEFPLLLAGQAGKDTASAALPMLDKMRAYPTTLFLDAAGNVKAIHTGFSGPATGDAYDELRREYQGLIEELLAGKKSD